MNAKAKIRLDSIEQAHRALEALPQHSPEELTKTQAIQQLIGPIRATQSKGYSLAAIGKVLSECGIPITTGALRAYVSEASPSTGRKKRSKATRAARSAEPAASGTSKSGPGVDPTQPTKPASKPVAALTSSAADLDWEPASRLNKAAPPLANASRSGLSVRADPKDR